MNSAKDIIDIVKDAPSLLKLISDLAKDHLFLATIVLGVIVIFILIQMGQSARDIFNWFRKARWSYLLFAILGIILIFTVVGISLFTLAVSQRPFPENLEPSEQDVTWGPRILLKWEYQDQDIHNNLFDIEVHQENKFLKYESYRKQYPFFPFKAKLEEGQFEWRVRPRVSETNWSKWQTTTYYKDRLARISKERILRVGLFADELHPYAFFDESKADRVNGIEVEIARMVAQECTKLSGWPSNLRVEFVRSEWLRGNLEDLQSGKVDLVMANTSCSNERKEKYNILFSIPYMKTYLAFVWRRTQTIKDWKELADKKVAIWEGSTANMVLKTFHAAPLHYRSTSQMFEALAKGDIDAILDDVYVMRDELLNTNPDLYEMRVFQPSETMKKNLSFSYPEEIAAYVSNDGSSIELLDSINRILDRPDVKVRIKKIVDSFVNASGDVSLGQSY